MLNSNSTAYYALVLFKREISPELILIIDYFQPMYYKITED